MSLKAMVKKHIPPTLWARLKKLLNRDMFKAYSQYGEDAYLNMYFKGKTYAPGKSMYLKKDGFYVDIGAYSPTECSNTYAFYKHGWRGINVDPTPGVIDNFKAIRKYDTNLDIAIYSEEKDITFYSWGSPNGFNTADPAIAQQRAKAFNKAPKEITVKSMPLSKMLDTYCPPDKQIDFMSVDVEGLDLEVLKSNDWEKYRPTLVVAETYCNTPEDLVSSDIYKYMCEKEYKLIAWLQPSVIFRDIRAQNQST